MKKDFKYPILSVFFDADSIPCVFVDEMIQTFANIEDLTVYYMGLQRDFNSFGWDMSTKDGSRTEIVMAVADAMLFVELHRRIGKELEKENLTFGEIDMSMVGICSVCDELLMPDDECYVDENTGEPLCDGHSRCNELTGNYIKSE